MPLSLSASAAAIDVTADGVVNAGAEFRALEPAWREGIVAMARAVVYDLQADTTHAEALGCARTIASCLG